MDIPGYVIGPRIGSGSHGVVYQATATGVGRPVAIKVIADPGELARRFQREVDVLAKLSWHPHIVQILDTGVLEDGTLWSAMELLGSALSRDGAQPAERVTDIGVQIASALAVAHGNGIVHRDVKPANILSGPSGIVKLSDFGIAADLAGDASTLSGLLGTLQYLAPEVFDGSTADARSDQYSLAATLCGVAVGGPPFATATGGQGIGALIRAKSAEHGDRLAEADLPESLKSVISRGMNPEPDLRYPSMDDFARALLTIQTEQHWPPTRYIGLDNREVPAATIPAASIQAPTPPPTPPPIASPATLFSPPEAPGKPDKPSEAPNDQPPSRRKGRWLIGAGVAVAIIVIGVVIALNAGSDPSADSGVTLLRPRGIAVGSNGSLFVADEGNRRVLEMDVNGSVAPVAGVVGEGTLGDDGPAIEAELDSPFGLAVDADGRLFITDTQGHLVRFIDTDGTISTAAGSRDGGTEADGVPALEADLGSPAGIAVDPDLTIYFTDLENHVVRAIDADGIISTVAGTATMGFSGDGGPAVDAQLSSPVGLAVGPDGTLYIADIGNSRVRAIGADGIIRTVAGTGVAGFGGDDGKAVDAQLNRPTDVAIGPDGRLYIADEFNNRVRSVDIDGVITTLAGTSERGFSGDGGPAAQAQLDGPVGVAIGTDGNLYVTDSQNNRIRAIATDGTIRTVVGG